MLLMSMNSGFKNLSNNLRPFYLSYFSLWGSTTLKEGRKQLKKTKLSWEQITNSMKQKQAYSFNGKTL